MESWITLGCGYVVATAQDCLSEIDEGCYMLTATIRSRVEPELKEEATRILESCGLDLSTAIRLFLNNVVVAKGLPFDILPNPTTIAAMEEARKLSARFSSSDEFFDELEGKNVSKERRKKAAKLDADKPRRP